MKLTFSKSLFTLILTLLLIRANGEELVVIESNYLGCNDSILLFTPKCGEYNSALFLLHGWSGNYSNWSDKADLQQLSDKYKTLIITPDGFYNSWYLNDIDPKKMQWREFFDKELYPYIVNRFNLEAKNCFITGLSMGGHGAINIFIDDTTRFRAAGSMSGVLNLQETNLKRTAIDKILGGYSPENRLFDSQSAINRVEQIEGCGKMLIISCGTEDIYAQSSIDFAERCKELKIANTLIMSPGSHSWDYWIFALDLHLFLFQKELST